MYCIREENPRIKAISLQITQAEKHIKALAHQLAVLEGVSKAEGTALPEDIAEEAKKEEENLEKYREEIKAVSDEYTHVKVIFKPRAVSEEMIDFFVTFSPREKNGIAFEDVVIGKKDWCGLKLLVSHDDHPTWVGRGRVPNGTSSCYLDVTEIDYRAYRANMHRVEFFQRRHGFGCEVQVEEASQYTKSKKKTMDFISQVVEDSPSEYNSIDDQRWPNTLEKYMEKNKALLGNETILYRGHYRYVREISSVWWQKYTRACYGSAAATNISSSYVHSSCL